MHSPDEAAAGIEKRAVTFAADTDFTEHSSKLFAPLHQATKVRANHHRMKKMVFNYLFDEKFDELDLCFKDYTPKEIADFYTEKGVTIFTSAILSLRAEPLGHLIKTVPHDVSCELLTRGNFSILSGFLGGKRIQEEDGRLTPESMAVFTEKLRMIFQLGNEQINNYIISNTNYKHMVERGLKLTHA